MTVFLGTAGQVKLRRANGSNWVTSVNPDDVNPVLNRLGVEGSNDNVLIGDRIQMSTDDERGLLFLPPSLWPSGQVEKSAAPYVHVNSMGGLRLYPTFESSVNNQRSAEYQLVPFDGPPVEVQMRIRDTIYNSLGNVTSYTFNSSREAIDTTTLDDRFRSMYDQGLLSGSGTLNCFFAHGNEVCGPLALPTEVPLMMMQLIQRIDVGSEFDCSLYITDKDQGGGQSVFYQLTGVVTSSGLQVGATELTRCRIDFVTTGEYRLLVGDPAGFLLQENDFFIQKERGLGFLLTEEKD